jgi:hypothetical protein
MQATIAERFLDFSQFSDTLHKKFKSSMLSSGDPLYIAITGLINGKGLELLR